MDHFVVQGTLKGLLQHHSSKASILRCSAFFIVQLSPSSITTGKTIALTRWTLVSKVTSLLINMMSRLVIAFLPRSKCLLISWRQSPSAVILEPKKMKSVTCQGKNTEVVCYSLLQWTTLCQNSSLCPICLGWPCMAWLIASLSYTRL